MRFIHFTGGNGFCGCDIDDYEKFPDDTTDEELDQIAEEKAAENAETLEYVATGWDGDFESEEERDAYYENANCSWTEITQEEYEDNCGEV